MKVYIGPYTSWFGPYQLAEKILFWKDRHSDAVMNLGHWLATGKPYKEETNEAKVVTKDLETLFNEIKDSDETWLHKFLNWIDSKKERKIKVRIDPYDTYSMDHTLAYIILPMLKQLKTTKHGSHMVDLEDVPEHLRTVNTEEYDCQYTFDFYKTKEKLGPDLHDRWDWVLDEMIWAFEQIGNEDHDNAFFEGYVLKDKEGYLQHQDRIDNGLRLFGKYFRGLWD